MCVPRQTVPQITGEQSDSHLSKTVHRSQLKFLQIAKWLDQPDKKQEGQTPFFAAQMGSGMVAEQSRSERTSIALSFLPGGSAPEEWMSRELTDEQVSQEM